MTRNTFFILLFIFLDSLSQNSIQIIESNKLEKIIVDQENVQKLSGNVIINYADMTIYLDTMIINSTNTKLNGWGNVNINNDSIFIKSDSIFLLKDKEKIYFFNNVSFNNDTVCIETNYLEYDFQNEIIKYKDGGKVTMQESTTYSNQLIYNKPLRISHFFDNVVSSQKEYKIISKDLIIQDSIIKFNDTTTLKNNEYTITFNNGYRNKNTQIESLNNIELINEKHIITADKLSRNNKKNVNIFHQNVLIKIDSSNYILGDTLIQNNKTSHVTGNSTFKIQNDSDLILISGDTISIRKENQLDIKNNVKIRGDVMNGECTNMTINQDDELIEMLGEPVLWFNKTQLTGEKIILFTTKNKIDSIYVPKYPFILERMDSIKYYNQITGNKLEGNIENYKVRQLVLTGNAKMKYFQLLNNKQTIGLNDILASKIEINFKEDQISNLNCIQEINSHYIEFNHTNQSKEDKKTLFIDGVERKYQEYFISK